MCTEIFTVPIISFVLLLTHTWCKTRCKVIALRGLLSFLSRTFRVFASSWQGQGTRCDFFELGRDARCQMPELHMQYTRTKSVCSFLLVDFGAPPDNLLWWWNGSHRNFQCLFCCSYAPSSSSFCLTYLICQGVQKVVQNRIFPDTTLHFLIQFRCSLSLAQFLVRINLKLPCWQVESRCWVLLEEASVIISWLFWSQRRRRRQGRMRNRLREDHFTLLLPWS